MMAGSRTSTEYRRNRATLLRIAREQYGTHAPCALCGSLVDLTATGRHPAAPSADHMIPLADGGTDDLSNLALVHYGCNARRGALHTNAKRKPSRPRRPSIVIPEWARPPA